MDPSATAAASSDYWMKSMLPASQLPAVSTTAAAAAAATGQLQPPFIPDYAWHAAASTGFGLPAHMPFISGAPTAMSSFDAHSALSQLDTSEQQMKMAGTSMKMELKHEYGDTYGTSEMYAAGVASMGSDHFTNSLNDQSDTYNLNSAAALAVVSSSVGGPSDLLMGLSSTDGHVPPPSNLTKEQLNAQQEAIRAHPLYPFLTVLFERCELATSTPRDIANDGQCRQETAAEMFKDDLMAFVKSKQEDKMRFYVADLELDKLMLNAIQVLRLHLLELEKVHELCDHFCQRYVNTLKDQMQMDMMHEERSSSVATNNASPTSPGVGPSSANPHAQYQSTPVYEPQIVNLPESMHSSQMLQQHSQQSSDLSASTSAGYDHLQHQSQQQQQQNTSSSSTAPTPNSSSSTTDAHTPNNYLQQQQDIKYHGSVGSSSTMALTSGSPRNSHSRNGSTPSQQSQHQQSSMLHNDEGDDALSIGGSLHDGDNGHESPASDHSANSHSLNSSGELQHSIAQPQRSASSSSSNGKRKVPKVFPKDAITKFRAWLFQNLQHPYPSEEQKKQLAQETNLTILQVNNWFINARRRIVQPMIDSNNRAGRSPHCNAFRNRRRRNSDRSPSGGGCSPNGSGSTVGADSNNHASSAPSAGGTMPNGTYSPDNSSSTQTSMMNAMASVAQYPAAAMFPSPYGFSAPGFPSQIFMPPNVVGAAYGMNPAQMAPDWMNFGGGSMDS